MIYYTKDNKEIIIPDEIFNKGDNHGKCGTIYKYSDNLCIKRYDRGIYFDHCLLNTDIYEDLKNIKNENLVDIKTALYKDKNNKTVTDAYLLTYYEEKYDDFLEIPTEYLLYNLEEIFKLIKKISEYKIRLHDLKRENIILTKDNIVLIDPDRWHYEYLTKDKNEIEKLNINNIMGMFSEITEESLHDNHLDFLIENNLYDYIISSKLFPLTSNKDRAMKVLTKRLNGYKRPINYVYSMKK